MYICNDCPRKCNASRTENGNFGGWCKAPELPLLARAALHFGEEPFISGKNGSGTIFFSGCSLGCVFCQNFDISQNLKGKIVSINQLAEITKRLECEGAHNINYVTPTHYFRAIEKSIEIYKPNIPLVYNSSGYELEENINKNIFDIYLFDFKFYSNEKSLKYSKCDDYFERVTAAIKAAVKLKGKPIYDNNGNMLSGVVVRHLILPQETNEAIKIIDWLNNNTPEIVLSLMSQYVPLNNSNKFKELDRRITQREYEKVLNSCYNCNFSDIYIQDRKSATTEYIPNFDLTGIK